MAETIEGVKVPKKKGPRGKGGREKAFILYWNPNETNKPLYI